MGNTQSKFLYMKIPTRVKDYHGEELEGEWKTCNLYKPGFSTDGKDNFNVRFLIIDDNVYMKPINRVYMSEFETLFGFGMGCDGYDENKTIQVLSPDDYKNNFLM